MNNQRAGIAIIAGIGMLTTFMPWFSTPVTGSIRGTQTDGWITFTLFLLPFLMALWGDRSVELKGTALYGTIVLGISAAVIGVWKIVDPVAPPAEGEAMLREGMPGLSIEYGLYLMVVAGAILPVVAFVFGNRKNPGGKKGDGTSYRSEVKKTGPPD